MNDDRAAVGLDFPYVWTLISPYSRQQPGEERMYGWVGPSTSGTWPAQPMQETVPAAFGELVRAASIAS